MPKKAAGKAAAGKRNRAAQEQIAEPAQGKDAANISAAKAELEACRDKTSTLLDTLFRDVRECEDKLYEEVLENVVDQFLCKLPEKVNDMTLPQFLELQFGSNSRAAAATGSTSKPLKPPPTAAARRPLAKRLLESAAEEPMTAPRTTRAAAKRQLCTAQHDGPPVQTARRIGIATNICPSLMVTLQDGSEVRMTLEDLSTSRANEEFQQVSSYLGNIQDMLPELIRKNRD